jgi:uncharacterized protein (TIGR01777 family)
MKLVVIAGGSGFIGRLLTTALLERGYLVHVLIRDEGGIVFIPRMSNHNPNLKFSTWRPNKGGNNSLLFEGADCVINLSGKNIASGKWTEQFKYSLINSRIKITSLIAKSISTLENPPPVWINASAVGIYGDSGNNVVDENTKIIADDFLSNLCKEWEEATQAATGKTRIVLSRMGIVLDKNEGVLAKMIKPFKLGLGAVIGSGKQWMSWIHFEDLVRQYIWAIENENISGVVNFTSPEPVTNHEFSKKLGKVLHRPVLFKVPGYFLNLVMGEQSSIILKGQRVYPDVALQNGFEFKYPNLSEALSNIIL